MKKILALLALNCCLGLAYSQIKTPAQLYGNLFEEVQMQKIYPDGKTFPDATPRRQPGQIIKNYEAQKNKPDINLADYVHQNIYAHACRTII